MNRYWISFYFEGPHGEQSDYRPVNWPPSPGILGYWNSGYRADGAITLCVWLEAKSESAARKLLAKDWPEAAKGTTEWRFFEHVAPDWTPGGRFQLSDWAQDRIKQTV